MRELWPLVKVMAAVIAIGVTFAFCMIGADTVLH